MIASKCIYITTYITTIDKKRFIALEKQSTQTVRHAIFPQQERDLDAAIVLESNKRILNETQSDQYTTVISLSELVE